MSDEKKEELFQSENDSDLAEAKVESPSQTPSQPAEGEGGEEQPKFITADFLNEKLEDFYRKRVQGERDKLVETYSKRYQKQVESIQKEFEAYKKAGHPIPEDVQQARMDQALHEILSSEGNDGATSGSETDQETLRNEVNAAAKRIMKESGVKIEADDPEVHLIDRTTPDPNVFLASLRQAIYQKKLRTGSAESESSPSARIPSSVQGTSKIPEGARQQFIKEYLGTKGKGLEAARAVRQKWAAKGLPVAEIIHDLNTGKTEV